jgi:hypothetical protein
LNRGTGNIVIKMLPSKSNQLKISVTRFYEEIYFQNGNHNYEAIFINNVVN